MVERMMVGMSRRGMMSKKHLARSQAEGLQGFENASNGVRSLFNCQKVERR